MTQEEKAKHYVSPKIWTIRDAKKGDVLATDSGDLCLFDGTVEDGKYPFAYCGLTRYGFEFYDRTLPFTHDYVSPATERQCDLLFQKIKEAGYKWDINKKELINMKDLSIKEKAKAYDEAVKKAGEMIKYYKTHNRNDKASITVLEHIFPELKEGEDERIKKEILELVSISGNGNQFEEIKDWLEKKIEKKTITDPKFRVGDEIREALIKAFKEYSKNSVKYWHDIAIEDIITWLEKQNEQSVEPDWCHHKVDFSGCSEEYRKAYYDGWNNCNMQHSQCNAELDDVIKCLVNGFKYFYSDEEENEDTDWGDNESTMSVAHIIEVLEKYMKSVKTE